MSIAKNIFHSLSSLLGSKNLHITRSLAYYTRTNDLSTGRLDYIRISSLELAAREIYSNNIKGNTAELGVYKGDFAKYINKIFPDRKLYLFDTFEGFDNRDVKTEIDKSFSTGKQDFADTSVEHVLSKMENRSNCIIKKGFFPESAQGVDDTFCFVSIDADLYDPIYNGLDFFYPKLSPGGYIFVHDFNNEEYKGARKAVIEYCQKFNCSYVPVGDTGGTAIISKGRQ